MDYKNIIDHYYPVIHYARKVQKYYLGKLGSPARIAPDCVGEMISALIAADTKCGVSRDLTEEEIKNFQVPEFKPLREVKKNG